MLGGYIRNVLQRQHVNCPAAMAYRLLASGAWGLLWNGEILDLVQSA